MDCSSQFWSLQENPRRSLNFIFPSHMKISYIQYEEFVSIHPDFLKGLCWNKLIYAFKFSENHVNPLIVKTINDTNLTELSLLDYARTSNIFHPEYEILLKTPITSIETLKEFIEELKATNKLVNKLWDKLENMKITPNITN